MVPRGVPLLLAACAIAVVVDSSPVAAPTAYTLTDAKRGPPLDGIGAISGGGAVARMLPAYDAASRAAILDYLFLPNFGAALQILKVEIGSGCQSTDGSEASHQNDPWVQNYERGYEWMMMKEAKARNPSIIFYGLAWGYPQWITCTPGTLKNCTGNIYTYRDQLATYIVNWVANARAVHNLTISYVGSWNERPYDAEYLVLLRTRLDAAGLSSTRIVAPDQGGWGFAGDVLANADLARSVYSLGSHYPGMSTTADARRTGKPLWASEETSTYNNVVGAGCWARLVNQNFVRGNLSASITWNIVNGYQKGTNWYRAGLMNAMQPVRNVRVSVLLRVLCACVCV